MQQQQQTSAVPAVLMVFAMIFTQLLRTPGMGHAIHELVALLRSLMAVVAVGVGGYMMLQMAQEEAPQMLAAPAPPPPLPAPAAPAPAPQINSIEDVPISVITRAIAEYKAGQAAKVQDVAPDSDATETVTSAR